MKQIFHKDWPKLSMALLFFCLMAFSSFGQADNCPSGDVLTLGAGSCTTILNGTNAGATDSDVDHACGGYINGDVWYYFTAPPSGAVRIETSDDGTGEFDTVIEVYDGCTGTSVGCSDDDGEGSFSLLYLTGLTPNAYYEVAVWEYNNDSIGSFNICAWDPPCIGGTYSLDTTDCAAGNYSMIVNVDQINPGSIVDITNDSGGLEFTGVGVGTYVVTGFTSTSGIINITLTNPNSFLCSALITDTIPVSCPVTNDECTDAIPVPVGMGSCTDPVSGSNQDATDSGIPHICDDGAGDLGGYLGGDVWFSVVVPASGNITIETGDDGTGLFDTVIEVYDACGGTVLGCDDDGVVAAGFSTVTLTGQTPGATLYVAVWEHENDAVGTFNVCAYEPVFTSDDCFGASSLPVGNGSCTNIVTGSNEGATDSGIPHGCALYTNNDVWFSFVAPLSGEVTIETSEDVAAFDTGIAVYDACGGTQIGCDDDGAIGPGSAGYSLLVLTGLTPGNTYYVAVWQYGGGSGTFNICAWDPNPTCTPPADPILTITDNECPTTTTGTISATGGTGTLYYYTGTSAADASNNAINDIGGSTTAPTYQAFPTVVYVCVVEEDAAGCRSNPDCGETLPTDCCVPPDDPLLNISNNACPETTGSISATGSTGTLYFYTGTSAADAANNAANDIGASTTAPAYQAFPNIVYVCVIEDDGTGCRSNQVCGETIPIDCCALVPEPVLTISDNDCPTTTGTISATGGSGTLYFYTGTSAAEASDNATNDIGGSTTAPAYEAFPNIVYVCVVEDDGAGCRTAPACGQTAPADCCIPPADPVLTITDNNCPTTTGSISATGGAGTLYYYTGTSAADASNNATNDIGGSTTAPAYEAFPNIVYVCVVEDDGAGCRTAPACGQTAPADCCIPPADPVLTITDNNCPTETGSISATGGAGTLYYYTGTSAAEASDNAANDIGGSTTAPAYQAFPNVVYVCVLEDDGTGCRSNAICGQTTPSECCGAPVPVLNISNNVCPEEAGNISASGSGGSLTYYVASDAATASDNAVNDVNGSVFSPTYAPFPTVMYICVVSESAGCRSAPVCGQTAPTNCDCTPPPDPTIIIEDNTCPDPLGAIGGTGTGGTINYYTGVDGLDAFNNATNNTNGSTTPPAYEAFPTVIFVCIVEEDSTGCRSDVICDQTNPRECVLCDVPDPTLTITDNACPTETGSISASGSGGFVYYYPAESATEAYDNAVNNTNANFFAPQYPAFPDIIHVCVVEQTNDGCRTTPVCGVTKPENCAACVPPADPVLTITDNACPETTGSIEATGGTGTLYYYTGASAQEASDNADLDVSGDTTPPVYTADTIYVCVVEDDGTGSGCRSNPVCGQTAPTACCVPPADPVLTITDNACPETTGSIEATGGTGTLYYYTGTDAQEASDNADLDFGGSTTAPDYTAFPDIIYVCVIEDDGTGCRSNAVCGQTAPTECAPTCPDDYADGGLANSLPALAGNLDEVTDYEADGTIKSTQVIGSVTATTVDYDSATDISLEAGFEVIAGTIFSAFIDGCNGGAGGEIETPAAINTDTTAQKKKVDGGKKNTPEVSVKNTKQK